MLSLVNHTYRIKTQYNISLYFIKINKIKEEKNVKKSLDTYLGKLPRP